MRRLIFLFVLLLPAVAFAGETVKVKVQKSTIFEEPRFFSRVVASVKYGNKLKMLNQERDWCYVEFQKRKGWIHKSGLTSGKFNLGTLFVGGSSASPTQDEVALAGKGFTPEVERGYKKSNPEMNYGLVDEIERYNVEDSSLYKFIREGGLKIAEVE